MLPDEESERATARMAQDSAIFGLIIGNYRKYR